MTTDPLCRGYGGKCDCGSLWTCERHDLLWEGEQKEFGENMTTDPLIIDAQKSIDESVVSEMPDDAGFQDRMSLFALLEIIRRDLEDALDRVKKRANGMKDQLLEEMVLHGIKNMNVHGLTIFSRIDRYVRKKSDKDGVTTQMICDALEEIGRGEMVDDGYSPASLKSLVVEMLAEDGDGVPEQLKELLNIGSKVNLVSTK